jgi:hypothetical protein
MTLHYENHNYFGRWFVLALLLAMSSFGGGKGVQAFVMTVPSPMVMPTFAVPKQFTSTTTSTTQLNMIGGFLQGLLGGGGPTEAEITDTVYFDIGMDNQPSGRIEMGLYGSTVPKVCVYHTSLYGTSSMRYSSKQEKKK